MSIRGAPLDYGWGVVGGQTAAPDFGENQINLQGLCVSCPFYS